MKRSITAAVIVVLFSTVAQAYHVRVSVTPETMKKYGLDVTIRATPRTIKEGKKPVRTTGHRYEITIKSKKVALKHFNVSLSVEKGEDSYVVVQLPRSSRLLKDNVIWSYVTVGLGLADTAYIILADFRPWSTFTYKLRIKDFVTLPEEGARVGKGEEGLPTYITKTKEKNAVKLILKVKRAPVAGEAIPLDIALANTGKTRITIGFTVIYRAFKFEVRDEKGQAVPMARLGELRIGKSDDLRDHFRYVIVPVKPGRSYRLAFDLSAFYDLTLPGKYKLTVAQRVNPDTRKSFMLHTTVEFVVSEAPFTVKDEPIEKRVGAEPDAPAEGPVALAQVFARGKEAESEAALKAVAAERKKMLAGLRKLLEQPKGKGRSVTTTKYALLSLGKLRAVEALDLLIANLDFVAVPDSPDEDVTFTFPTIKYPAVAALIEIGPCVVDGLLDAVAEGKLSKRTVGNAGYVIVSVLGFEKGHRKVLAYASGIKDRDKRARLLSNDIMGYYDHLAPKPKTKGPKQDKDKK